MVADAKVRESVRTLGQLQGMFANEEAAAAPRGSEYRVQAWCPVVRKGGFLGSTVVEPAKWISEFFMTHAHFYLRGDRALNRSAISGAISSQVKMCMRHKEL